jgi:hypothetical protein
MPERDRETAAAPLAHKYRHPITHAAHHEASDHEGATEFHVKKLHDGTYHHERIYAHDHMGPVRPSEEGSGDLDSVHDALEEHFNEPNEDEEQAPQQ